MYAPIFRSAFQLTVLAAATAFTVDTSSACEFAGYTKSGERRCATTYVYKKAKRWDDPSQYSNKAEKCRATCLRSAMKMSSGSAQASVFTLCKRKNGCS